MIFIISGIFSFVFMAIYDYYGNKEKINIKRIFIVLTLLTFIFSFIGVIYTGNKLEYSYSLNVVGFVFSTFFGFLLIYSLFLELPLKGTYISKEKVKTAYTKGTYALSRHPGVLWLFLFMLSVFLSSGKINMLIYSFIWTAVNFLYVIWQEKYIFTDQFENYKDYQKSTPIIIPDLKSIRMCIKSIKTIRRNR